MKVKITIEMEVFRLPPPNPYPASVTTNEEATDLAQTSIEDYIEKSARKSVSTIDRSMHFTYYDKRRKGIMQCSRCGKVGYNIRTHDRHKDL